MNKIAIVNAPLCGSKFKDNKYDYIIAVEKGYVFLKILQIVPDIVIGDFDSFKLENIDHGNIIKKNDQLISDLELAIKHAKTINSAAQIYCYQTDGKRNSHYLSQINMVINYEIEMIYDTSRVVKLNKKNKISNIFNKMKNIDEKYKYLSIFNMTNNEIQIKNAKYPYKGKILLQDNTQFISNEWNEKGDIEITFSNEPKAVAILELQD